MVVCEAGPGDVIGERALAEGVPSLVTTRSLETCVVLQLPAGDYKSMRLAERYARRKSTEVVHAQLDEPRVAGASDATLDDFRPVRLLACFTPLLRAVFRPDDSNSFATSKAGLLFLHCDLWK